MTQYNRYAISDYAQPDPGRVLRDAPPPGRPLDPTGSAGRERVAGAAGRRMPSTRADY